MILSIITICKDEGTKLQTTLQSIAEQTFQKFEHIFIDGQSTDKLTLSIIEKYKSTFTYFISEQDAGIYNAQNKGLRQATGDFVLFLNAGDSLAGPKVLENVARKISEVQSDVYYGNMWIEDREGMKILGEMPRRIHLFHMLRSTLWHPASFIRRSLFEEFGYYNEKYKIVSDYEFFLKLILSRRIRFLHLEQAVSVFNLEGIGSSAAFSSLHTAERSRVQKELVPRYWRFLFRIYSKWGVGLRISLQKIFRMDRKNLNRTN